MKMDVVGFGALNLDRLYQVKHLAKRGEHEEIIGFEELPGGSAANTIAGLARLGISTGFIGAVGKDPEGELMLEDFKRRGVDVGGTEILDARTGIIVGFVDSEGERTLYPYPGANSKIGFSDRQVEYAKNARFVHLSSFVDEKQLAVQEELVSLLPDEVKISFSPGIIYSRKGLKRLLSIIRRSEVLFVNESEVRALTGKEHAEGSRILHDSGAKTVAVTLGSRGCYLLDGEGRYEVSAEKTKAVDTTGAGDAFAAGFLFGLLSGKKTRDAGVLGNKTAACCIRSFGARTGLPSKEELSRM